MKKKTDPPVDPGLRQTEKNVRAVMPDESPIDLDEHARFIAEVAHDAHRRADDREADAEAKSQARLADPPDTLLP